MVCAGNTKGEIKVHHWPPVWLIWNRLHNYWQFLFLFAQQTNPNQSNRRSTVQWYFPPLVFPGFAFVSSVINSTIMGKIDMLSYQMSSSTLKYSYNPDKQSLPLQYFLAIKVNLSKLSLASPKLVHSSNSHFYDRQYLNLQLPVHSQKLSLSLCLSTVLYTCPFFPFHINMMTVCILDYSYFDNKRLWTIRCFTLGLAYNIIDKLKWEFDFFSSDCWTWQRRRKVQQSSHFITQKLFLHLSKNFFPGQAP